MISVIFSHEDIKQLCYERYHHPHPKVQQKMEVMLLKSHNLPHKTIASIAQVSETTVWRYIKDYTEGGIEKLKEINFYRPQSRLNEHKETIEKEFRENPAATIPEAMDRIEKLTGIKRSPTQIGKFLKSIGLERRKIGMIPAKADPEVQEHFIKEQLEPCLEEAESGRRVVFFVDAAHFVLSPFLGYLWCFSRLFIKAPAGRSRFNVLGALNAITHELIKITTDTYINADSVCELLRKIAEQHIGLPITLILDNARYQKCFIIQEVAKSLNIELIYLPPYSPNLNIIERLWKFIKKECLYSKYYSNFADFKTSISQCLNQTHLKHKEKLDSLLTLRFQRFEKEQILSF
jgi:transposase